MMKKSTPSDKIKVKRVPNRGIYNRQEVYDILDKEFLCQVGFVFENYPVIIPTLFGRQKDTVFLHGSIKSRLLNTLKSGVPVCITVARVTGLVLARSVFHHSANYESAVLFGTCREILDPADKLSALEVITEHIIAGRWNEARIPNDNELKATSVMAFDIEEASAKRRTGGPKDDQADYPLDIWAGVVPIETQYGNPVEDDLRLKDLPVPDSVRNYINRSK